MEINEGINSLSRVINNNRHFLRFTRVNNTSYDLLIEIQVFDKGKVDFPTKSLSNFVRHFSFFVTPPKK